MGPLIQIILKDKDSNKPLDGPGIALVATTLDPTIRTGADKEIVLNPLDHAFLLKMIMLWICLPLSAKPQMTKNMRSTARQANALNVENKVTLFAIAPIKRHALIQLALSKLKITTNQSPLTPLLQLCLLLHE